MYRIIVWFLVLVATLIVSSVIPMSRGEILVFCVVFIIVLGIWAAAVAESYIDTVKDQAKDFYSLAKYEANKKSYQASLASYKEEMQTTLVDKYREFEQVLAQSVTDSKLIAAVLKKSSYGDVLQRYESRVEDLICRINGCERDKADAINKMLTRQADFSGWALLLPKNLRYNA